MSALATVGSLTSSQQDDPNLTGLIQNTTSTLQGAISAMAQDAGVLGKTQSMLNDELTTLSNTQTAMSTQLSSVQDVDMAQTLSNITLGQTQLQASYQLLANASSLSLAKFLPVS